MLGEGGIGLVYGGASVGLMGQLADAALQCGAEVIGVIPERLVARELAHRSLTELKVVGSMHARKALMAELSDAFIALPGGYGTLDELFEAVTWAQLGLHARPIVLLNSEGFYDPLLAAIRHASAEGFIASSQLALLRVAPTPRAALDLIASTAPPLPTSD